jgi:hypothetical protein
MDTRSRAYLSRREMERVFSEEPGRLRPVRAADPQPLRHDAIARPGL